MKKRYFLIGALCDVGKVRTVNQDSILIRVGSKQDDEFGLFVVADGLGGLSDGQIASQMVVERLSMWWESELAHLMCNNKDVDIRTIDRQLYEVVVGINENIIAYATRRDMKMASTLSLIFILKNQYIIKHLGDSRIYIINQNVQQVTEDHSWVNTEIKAGKMSVEAARGHPKRNILTHCLGITTGNDMYEMQGELQKDDIILLCSDGFYTHVYDVEMRSIIYQQVKNKTDHMQCIVKELFEKTMMQGGRDNISIILVKQQYCRQRKNRRIREKKNE